MALNIKSPEAHRLAQELAEATGQNMTRAVTEALRAALERERLRQPGPGEARLAELNAIAEHCASLPVYDDRKADDIIGYDERGLPG